MKNFLKKKWVRIILIILIILIVVGVVLGSGNKEVSYRTVTITKGDIVSSLSGSGTITAVESRKEIAKVSSTVQEVYFEEGDLVNEGDAIIKLDSEAYEMNLKSQQTSVKQAEISKQNLNRQVENMKIKAPVAGTVKNLIVDEGSYVTNFLHVCDIDSTSRYEVTLKFLASAADRVSIGNRAEILLVDSYSYVNGYVSYVGTSKSNLASGGVVIDITITVDSAEYSLDGLKAKASIIANDGGKITSSEASTFKRKVASQVLANASGEVSKLYVKEGQYVNAGDMIAELKNEDILASLQTTNVSLQNAYDQLKYAKDKLEDYTITAPISGIITAQTVKVGDVVAAGTLLTTVSNTEEFEFQIPIDELDISKISMDNKVLVTVDAIPETEENPIVGRISKIPLEGVTIGGVTDYYITIAIPAVDSLRISMNASAEIILAERNDVLTILVEAIQKENGKSFVEVIKNGVAEKVEITTGISNSGYVEIISGLNEGDEVVIPDQRSGLELLLQ